MGKRFVFCSCQICWWGRWLFPWFFLTNGRFILRGDIFLGDSQRDYLYSYQFSKSSLCFLKSLSPPVNHHLRLGGLPVGKYEREISLSEHHLKINTKWVKSTPTFGKWSSFTKQRISFPCANFYEDQTATINRFFPCISRQKLLNHLNHHH